MPPAEVNRFRQLPAALVGRSDLFTNINPADKSGKMMLARMMGQSDVTDVERESEVWRVTHYAIHTVDGADEHSGELKQWLRTVLFTADGHMLTFGSNGVAKCIAALGEWFTAEDWSAGVPLRVISGKGRQGGRWLALEIVPDSVPTPKLSRRKAE